VATERTSNGIKWKDPYGAAIRNRLRIDNNLSDIMDKSAARKNLGLTDMLEDLDSRVTRSLNFINTVDGKLTEQQNKIDELIASFERFKTTMFEDFDTTVSYINGIAAKLRSSIGESEENLNSYLSSHINALEKIPVGTILPYVGSLDNIPDGWHVCDGTAGTIDLRNLFPLGTNDGNLLGVSGGESSVTLSVDNMPSHYHGGDAEFATGAFDTSKDNGGREGAGFGLRISLGDNEAYDRIERTFRTSWAGGNQAHNNMPPYRYVYYIQKLS